MNKILITGFEPFDGQLINPSIEILERLKNEYHGVNLIKLFVPTVFRESIQMVLNEIEKIKPDIVIMLGQAGGRKEISFERISINIDDANIPDNRGNKPIDEMIYKDGENAYFATLPIKKLNQVLIDNHIPSTISNSAGTYVCNHLMYGVLHYISESKIPIQAGFIHVPFVHDQVKNREQFSMSINDLVKAIELCINALTEV
jgi:pyroglutamyl-peptidase